MLNGKLWFTHPSYRCMSIYPYVVVCVSCIRQGAASLLKISQMSWSAWPCLSAIHPLFISLISTTRIKFVYHIAECFTLKYLITVSSKWLMLLQKYYFFQIAISNNNIITDGRSMIVLFNNYLYLGKLGCWYTEQQWLIVATHICMVKWRFVSLKVAAW